MFTTPFLTASASESDRGLLAAYLLARRRFGRTPGGRDGHREWNRRLIGRRIDQIAAEEDLRDRVMAGGEVETAGHLCRIGPDGELRVVRTGRAARKEAARAH